MNPPYSVPIISPNSHREETITQVADITNYLTEVTDSIFKKINDRLDTNNRLLNSISERIEVANTKVVALTGTKKATKVFSSSKYPAMDIKRHYVSLFDKTQPLSITRHKIKSKVLSGNDEIFDMLHFYHVKVNKKVEVDNKGLGSLPVDVESVNDLLLYGTGKNPYKQYVMSDTLKFKQKLKEDDYRNGTNIGAAPLSISDRKALMKSTTETYFYSPDIGDVPAIDVPLDLPDLPGIADDLRYINELGPGIAPSVTTTPNVPELPIIIDSPVGETLDESILFEDEVSSSHLQLPGEKEENVIEVSSKSDAAEAIVAKAEILPSKRAETNVPRAEDNGDNARASLMEAIRQAGGSKNAKLRSAESKSTKAVVSGGDLMADLHSKLAMRRKGISGKKKQESTNYGNISAMDRISAMIPAPTQKSDFNESTNTEDEDWD